ncbi:Stk1 family PASTA domain-containing Ser/Thr kinase [Actinoplanes derwentensis]|uniref:PASTA domain-containing protein n=1 Tax=Actinoplanes derwentensis TaxID=113562 RepID=A0A1H2CSL1_9ACTN|nr:Stk1 family PASTA domain-containing Ser/Thr kinase [Actinoplanes derwentensis]SDT73508.1 PASTA domain-containing protein [Actinoplanes derwentensis]
MPEERDPERPDAVDESPEPGGHPGPDAADRDVWTGRAGVRPYGAVRRDPYEEESGWADPAAVEPAGRWWAPIAVGTVAVVLLSLLGFGVAVIVQSAGEDTEPPTATPTAVRITTGRADPGNTTPPAQQVETPATPATTDPADAEVTVPALRGMPLADAQAALSRTGLGWRVIRRESDAEPDTVIACDPEEGQQVPSDTRITLIVAAAQDGSSPSVVPSASSPG